MALTPQDYFGNMLMTEGGAIAGSCCCGGAEPSSCTDDYPEILVTVLDADYAGGDLNWAGQTWTQAEVQAGTQKIACPTSYTLQAFTTIVSPSNTQKFGYERWVATNLLLVRGIGYARAGAGATQWYQIDNYNADDLDLGYPNISLRIFKGYDTAVPPFTHTVTSTYYANLGGIISGVARATKSDYRILNAWFGSIVIGGITYTWARGNGW